MSDAASKWLLVRLKACAKALSARLRVAVACHPGAMRANSNSLTLLTGRSHDAFRRLNQLLAEAGRIEPDEQLDLGTELRVVSNVYRDEAVVLAPT